MRKLQDREIEKSRDKKDRKATQEAAAGLRKALLHHIHLLRNHGPHCFLVNVNFPREKKKTPSSVSCKYVAIEKVVEKRWFSRKDKSKCVTFVCFRFFTFPQVDDSQIKEAIYRRKGITYLNSYN